MTEMTRYEPGVFCWVELMTTDWPAARDFYTGLFGWTANETPMGEGQPPYVMLEKNGKSVGALYQGDPAQGIPPNWSNYVAVSSADETAAKAKSLGGTVMMEPFDVFDFGRMSVMQDPQGAVFAIWEAKKHIGATVRDEVNTLCWNELQTSDVAAARRFYEQLFGWKFKVSDEYSEIHTPQPIGGIMDLKQPGVPPNWMPYFAVDDCEGIVDRAQKAGAKVYMPPTDIPNAGRFSVLADPQGAVFAVIKLVEHGG